MIHLNPELEEILSEEVHKYVGDDTNGIGICSISQEIEYDSWEDVLKFIEHIYLFGAEKGIFKS